MILIRIKLPVKSLILLRHFNNEKSTCQVFLYDVSNSITKLKPVHQGKVSFTLDKGKMRPYRYEERTGHTYRFLKAKDIILLLGRVNIIALISSEKPSNINEYMEFLEHCKAKKPKILPVCEVCLRDRELTSIKLDNSYNNYGKVSCRACASSDIRQEYVKRGIPITSSARKFFNSQLDRLKDVKQVIDAIWDPIKSTYDPNSTLFDVIMADKNNQPISMKHYFSQQKNSKLMDPDLINHFGSIGIKKLMPVQIKSIEAGLLNREDLLVVAGTSSGKTLVGELAGLQNWKSRNEKFIFVTPLVALTNQKYDSFKKRYQKLGLRVAIRVGKSRIVDSNTKNKHPEGNFSKADIIVATYEALDWIFRSGQWKKIPNIGTLVIDEFQLLADEERGVEVDGLMARIRTLYPNCQIIGLSATIGNEKQLAKEMNLKLVNYMERPIPLERHLIISDGEEKKIDILERLIKEESKILSKSRHRGQTLIFTNTRRRVQEIGNSLKASGFRSDYYHAGMTYNQRRQVEGKFERSELEVLTTTAALGAGADFPVSQVIFERPAMGSKWISIAEYHQMAGRAGRLGFHDLGKAVLIATVGEKIYTAQKKSEEQIAFDILTGTVEDIDGEVKYEQELDQTLAYISAAFPVNNTNLKTYYSHLFFRTNQLSNIIKVLNTKGLIASKNDKWYITPLGRAISESFLTPSFGYEIAKKTQNHTIKEIAVEIASLDAVYITSRIQAKLEHALKTHISSKFFSDGVLDMITNMSSVKGKLSPMLMNKIRFWLRNFLNCKCRSNPYCKHPREKISLLILEMRMEGMSISQITNVLAREYDFLVYQGDLINWLDEVIHAINAIGRLAKAMQKNELVSLTNTLAINIEAPEINFSLNKSILKKVKAKPETRMKPTHLRRRQKKQHSGRKDNRK